MNIVREGVIECGWMGGVDTELTGYVAAMYLKKYYLNDMDTSLLLEGAIIGLLIAAPVGPIGVLCIKRSLANGPIVGFATGLGAATADACYGAIAAFGLTFVSEFITGYQTVIQVLGILFLTYLGVTTFVEAPSLEEKRNASRTGLLVVYATTAFLTLTNPATIVSFAAIFAGIGITTSTSYTGAALLVVGVFTGSALWWLILSNGVGLLRTRVNHNVLVWVNRISGIVILGFAIALSIRLAQQVT